MLTENQLLTGPAFQKLVALPLLPNEYIIMGSGIMFAVGMRNLESLNDLDLFVSQSGWEKVKNLASYTYDTEWKCNQMHLFDELIEIYNGWGPSHYDFDDLFSRVLKVGKFNFMSFKDVIYWKTERNAENDKGHLALIDKFLKENPQYA